MPEVALHRGNVDVQPLFAIVQSMSESCSPPSERRLLLSADTDSPSSIFFCHLSVRRVREGRVAEKVNRHCQCGQSAIVFRCAAGRGAARLTFETEMSDDEEGSSFEDEVLSLVETVKELFKRNDLAGMRLFIKNNPTVYQEWCPEGEPYEKHIVCALIREALQQKFDYPVYDYEIPETHLTDEEFRWFLALCDDTDINPPDDSSPLLYAIRNFERFEEGQWEWVPLLLERGANPHGLFGCIQNYRAAWLLMEYGAVVNVGDDEQRAFHHLQLQRDNASSAALSVLVACKKRECGKDVATLMAKAVWQTRGDDAWKSSEPSRKK